MATTEESAMADRGTPLPSLGKRARQMFDRVVTLPENFAKE